MTLDEAIVHCKEREDCSECGKNHMQLREWLEELKTLRAEKADKGAHNALSKVRNMILELKKTKDNAFDGVVTVLDEMLNKTRQEGEIDGGFVDGKEYAKKFCTYFQEMEYSRINRSSCVLARGRYMGYPFLVINTRHRCPCGYVNVGGTMFDGVTYDEIKIDCHGGLTYSNFISPLTYEKGWWIGWDYAHLNDYDPDFPMQDNTVMYETEDIVHACIDVIKQIHKACWKAGR